jgi:hypothetical protein
VSGRSHLNSCGEYLEKLILVPSGLKLFGMDATFGSYFLFEQVESNIAKDGKIFRSLVFSYSAMIFIHGDIQDPMKLIFDTPVFANSIKNAFSIAGQTCDEVAHLLGLFFANDACANDHNDTF